MGRIGVINGSIRKGSQTNEICTAIQNVIECSYFELNEFKEISTNYLEGDSRIDKMNLQDLSTLVLVIPSYYVLPSPIFLNFINLMNERQIKEIFSEKTIYIVSVQDGDNLNEIHVDSIRRFFNKIFHFHKISTCKICTDFCMVNRKVNSRVRMIESIKALI